MDRINILGVGFDAVTKEDALSRCMEIVAGKKGYVATPNPEIICRCRRDKEASEAVNGASLVVADGIGVIYASRILGTPIKNRVTGIDLASAVMGELEKQGKTLYLLGAKPGVAEDAAEKLALLYPELNIVGTNDGYFKDDAPVIDKINSASPDVLFVCLGAPRQEQWTKDNIDKLNVSLCMCLGGSLDVFSGNVERAPRIFQKLGLEWFYRLLKEPKRIGRMAVLPKFILLAVKERLCPKCSK